LIDPTFRGGLIDVPISKTLDTKGRADFMKGTLQKDLSLCCLFQRGRCSLQERCHQIHVDTQYMASVRQQNSQIVSCCRRCKDSASLTSSAVSFFACYFGASHRTVTVNAAPGADKRVDADLLAFTTGLESWLCDEAKGDPTAVISTRKVCRLHLGGRCKYGKDCKYVHLCSQLGESFLSAAPTPTALAAEPSVLAPRSVAPVKPAEAWRPKDPSPAKHTAFFATKAATKVPEGNSFFDRVNVSTTTEFSRSTSVPEVTSADSSAEDTPAPLYFTADRFAAPMTLPAQHTPCPAERSGSLMFPRSNGSSCLERSVALTGLCFDPALLWDHSDDLPSAKKDMFGASCELLSATCSEAHSARKSDRCAFY